MKTTSFLSSLLTVLCLLLPTAAQARPNVPELKDDPRYLLYIPVHNRNSPRPLVVALSPTGTAEDMYEAWHLAADKRGWFILASREFRNGIDNWVGPLDAIINEVTSQYLIDGSKIILAGFSGGGMASHTYSVYRPYVRVVVTNSGLISTHMKKLGNYPRWKTAVFMASPTDTRYIEMKQNQMFLASLGWKTLWIDFEGGHNIAPEDCYEAAAKWIESQW